MNVAAGFSTRIWILLFFAVVGLYGLMYAPYGLNETDGGFLTGLAWQVLNGKVLYADLIYVRPPLPVWLRALELQLLPADWTILGERWIFYLKMALYTWLAAAILTKGPARWQLATFAFVVSAHCYPAAAWHTIDGILFSVLSAWLLFKVPGRWTPVLAGIALFAALLCKQSFYPLAVFGLVAAFFSPLRLRAVAGLLIGLLAVSTLFISYLYQNNLLTGFLRLTGAAASGGQAWQHGVMDYFRVQPVLALLTVVLLGLVIWTWKTGKLRMANLIWATWLAALISSYVFAVWRNQDFTPPFAQARLLFWLAGAYFLLQISRNPQDQTVPAFGLLLAISWCSSVSWGYNLPILFTVPGVWAFTEISRWLPAQAALNGGLKMMKWASFLTLAALLGAFRYGYEFVYRDGRRSAMTENMGQIFPALHGIYSDGETAALYRELRDLSAKYGPNFKTLPAFPQANFLTRTVPPLPLDWVVKREMNADSALVMTDLQQKNPVLLLEKRYLPAIETDPELTLVRAVLHTAERLEETPHFLVLRNSRL